jgi:hypothetical protein
MGMLEGILEEFNSQNVANTLLGVCDNGGEALKPRERVMGQVEGRAWAKVISGEFNSKKVANTLGVCDYGDDGASGNGTTMRLEAGGADVANTDWSDFGFYFRFKKYLQTHNIQGKT